MQTAARDAPPAPRLPVVRVGVPTMCPVTLRAIPGVELGRGVVVAPDGRRDADTVPGRGVRPGAVRNREVGVRAVSAGAERRTIDRRDDEPEVTEDVSSVSELLLVELLAVLSRRARVLRVRVVGAAARFWAGAALRRVARVRGAGAFMAFGVGACISF